MNRREFLRTAGGAAGATTATTAATGPAAAQGGGNKSGGNKSSGNKSGGKKSSGGGTKTYKLGGKVEGWQGQAPASIKGKSNPPLVLKPGQKYKIVWENLDGMSHDFTIQDSNGNNIKQTKKTAKKGETLSLTFTATKKMAQYICTVHPSTMKAEVQQSATKQRGTVEPHEMGVPLQAHYVGVATVLMMTTSLIFTFYTLKYGESAHTKGGNN